MDMALVTNWIVNFYQRRLIKVKLLAVHFTVKQLNITKTSVIKVGVPYGSMMFDWLQYYSNNLK